MAWSVKGKPTVVRVTKKLATEVATMEGCPRDRKMRKSIYADLKREMIAGTYRNCDWAICTCAETGKTYRVNGKHTSTILAEDNDGIEMPYATLSHYQADTLADVADLYRTFDVKVSGRTGLEITVSYAGSNPSLAELPGRALQLAVTAICYAEKEDSYGDIPVHQRSEKVLRHSDFVLWLHRVIGTSKESELLRKGAIAAAMFRTWQRSQKDAEAFWTAVRDGSDPKVNSPTRRLQKLLWTFSSRNGGLKTAKQRLTMREWYVKSLHAWNAWRSNTDTDLKYYPNSATPSPK